MWYTLNFIMGFVTSIIFVILFIQMWVAGTLRFSGRQMNPYLNNRIEDMFNSPNTSFIGVIFFIFIGYYMFYATVKGNIKFGLRFFSFTFYPLVPGETFVNSFLINAVLMNIYMHGLIYSIIDLFRQFHRGTQAAIFFQVIVKNSQIFGWAFRR